MDHMPPTIEVTVVRQGGQEEIFMQQVVDNSRGLAQFLKGPEPRNSLLLELLRIPVPEKREEREGKEFLRGGAGFPDQFVKLDMLLLGLIMAAKIGETERSRDIARAFKAVDQPL